MMKPSTEHPTTLEIDSDTEDDAGKLLNVWLGELDKMKQSLDVLPSQSEANSDVKRRSHSYCRESKNQYRCSLIKLDETKDDELDAILGELSILESQFSDELIGGNLKNDAKMKIDVGKLAANRSSNSKLKNRTESPDNDSAFCDNLSVLSSSSSVRTEKSKSSGISSSTSPTTVTLNATMRTPSPLDEETRQKAEKIRLAVEKIKEASIKKIFVKVFTADESAKSLLVDENMTVAQVTRTLAEKNHVKLHPKWAIVEFLPDLFMERVYEDHELLVENCLMWKVDSKNTLWFIERPEKFDLFFRPEIYLLGSSSSQRDEHMEDHSRQELLEEYFSSTGVGAPEVEGTLWLKVEAKKAWKKFYFILRTSGLYYAPKGKKSSKDLVCLATFDVNQIYYGVGWKKKYKAPSNYCFAIKNPQIQAKSPKHIRYLCADNERELHQWVIGIRIAKNGKQIYDNYRGIEEEITHADIDILTSKRYLSSDRNPTTVPVKVTCQSDETCENKRTLTPSSENKSLDSALSSGIVSELSNARKNQSNSATPLSTIDRSSQSSSSSGCLSEKSNININGFESDFPAGGTIKKRPSVNPRFPLTSTTWGLLRDSDDEDNDVNIRLGGDGTLLRNSVLQNKFSTEKGESQKSVHDDVDPLSIECETNLEMDPDFPPPPPPIDLVMRDNVQSTVDLPLPPPPPELFVDETSSKRRRCISFDENVHLIEDDDVIHCNKLGSTDAFLKDLQRVMNKKWQVSEKCRENCRDTPHTVLGFRDEITPLVGAPQEYNRDNTVGAWVLQSQIYSHPQQLQPQKSQESLCEMPETQLNLYFDSYSGSVSPLQSVSKSAVVLREPPLNYDIYYLQQEKKQQEQKVLYSPQFINENYSTLKFSHPSNLVVHEASVKTKKPPPPPRRSESTHLTSQS